MRFLDIIYILKNKIKSFSPIQLIVYSFAFTIFIGTLLLLLPFSTKNGKQIDFLTAVFTSVSCTCVTGLSLHDTWTYFSFFGQFVMLLLIQIGGLGLISFTTGFALAINRRLGLRDIKIMHEGTQSNLMDIPRIIKTVFISTFMIEIIGALTLCSKFVPMYGYRGLWLAVFLSVSSYCNAGFDITGFIKPNSSLSVFNDDPFIMIVISLLVIIGGLGFLAVMDLYAHFTQRFNTDITSHHHLSLQTRVVLKSAFYLLLTGTFLFFSFEFNNTLQGLSFWQKVSSCFMQSASSRTAGLFAIDLSKQYNITKFVTVILMFIGASPFSSGGGIKTVAFVVLIMTMWSTLCGREEAIICNRKINKSTVYRSVAICVAFIVFISFGTLMLSMLEAQKPISSIDILYEVVSAVSTTGVSIGITSSLSTLSKCILMMLMFVGRVGPISFILAITSKKDVNKYKMIPDAKLIIG